MTTDTQWIRDNPPRKNPYFTLPDVRFLPLPDHLKPLTTFEEVVKPTCKDIFGPLANMNDDSQAEFLLRLISHSSFEPNFQAMADALNIQYGSNV
jgi:hypothetical protein